MEIYLIKQGDNSFKVAHESDYEKLKKIKIGKTVLCKITQKRNIKFHNKFFALINLVYQNQEHYNNIDHLRKDLIINAGFYAERTTFDGQIIQDAKSISFSKMNQEEFNELYNRVIDVIVKEFGFEKELIIDNINKYF